MGSLRMLCCDRALKSTYSRRMRPEGHELSVGNNFSEDKGSAVIVVVLLNLQLINQHSCILSVFCLWIVHF